MTVLVRIWCAGLWGGCFCFMFVLPAVLWTDGLLWGIRKFQVIIPSTISSLFFSSSSYGLSILDTLSLLYLLHNFQIVCPVFLTPFSFCFVWKSQAQRSFHDLCPICYCVRHSHSSFLWWWRSIRSIRPSLNFHLCWCSSHCLSTLSIKALWILIMHVLISQFCHSSVCNLLESGSYICSNSDFKLVLLVLFAF